jgi:excinuclease ABC subunit B
MYHGDQSRKETLINYGFRLPSALDNRPLRFDEFLRRVGDTIYVSATPDEWELSRSGDKPVEQLVRPTGLLDPTISVRPIKGQIDDLMNEISVRAEKKERSLVTVLTKRMAEDLSKFFEEKGIRVKYLHSDIKTLARSAILTDLRKGNFDVLIGVNLLREGLDLPEVSLVAILDADKQGFLRNKISLIQTMGRAAPHVNGKVILYADSQTPAMQEAIDEGIRRRTYQEAYNTRLGITPTGIEKPIRDALTEGGLTPEIQSLFVDERTIDSMTPKDSAALVGKLTKAMKQAGKNLDFELAAQLRDTIIKIEEHI